MKFNVLRELENPMLNRRQFYVEITDIKTTPKRNELTAQFAAKMGIDPRLVIVDTIKDVPGNAFARAYIKSYKDEDALKKIEVKNNLKKREDVMNKLYPKKDEPKEEKAE